MTEKNYTYAQLCEAIEKAHGRITDPFSLQYPSDPRCRYSLRIYVGCGSWNMYWSEAENGDNVAELLGIPESSLAAFVWRPESGIVLKVVMREDDGKGYGSSPEQPVNDDDTLGSRSGL